MIDYKDVKPEDLMSCPDAAKFFGVNLSTIRNYIRAGRLKAYRISGLRKVIIHKKDLVEMLEPIDPRQEEIEEEE